jgi:hypothetical protein
LSEVTTQIANNIPYVVKLVYAIAGVVAVVGANFRLYQNEIMRREDFKKSIMMIVGACLFLVAAAQALPLFFGVGA